MSGNVGLNATAIFELVQSQVGTTGNVFAGVAGYLISHFSTEPPEGLYPQLYVLSVLLGVELVCLVLSIATRVCTGHVWLFRLYRTRFGTYCGPHFALGWQLAVLVFAVALQVIIWQLKRFSDGQKIHGFMVQKVVVWLGFWIGPVLATYSLAVSRALELAKSPIEWPGWIHLPLTIHLVFIAAPILAVLGALSGAIYTNTLYSNLLSSVKRAISLLYATGARSASLDATQTAQAIAASEAQVESAEHAFSSFLRAFEVCFEVSLGFNLVAWAICLMWSVPHLRRMHQSLYRRRGLPGLGQARRAELRVAFLTASSTVAILSVCSIAYSVEVVYAIVSKAGDQGFVKKADTRQASQFCSP